MNNDLRMAGADRVGDWMITFTGKRFYPLDPRPEDVNFRDIGHALSMICRYGGHIRRFYSVAEHCALMAAYFEQRGDLPKARYALIHDAPEAYIGDMVRPLKRDMAAFTAAERGIAAAIQYAILGKPWQTTILARNPETVALVDAADKAIVIDERNELFRPEVLAAADWYPKRAPLGVQVVGHPPHIAERDFMATFVRLFPEIDLDR